MEMGKGNKSVEELDKLLIQAKIFTTTANEKRGRLPVKINIICRLVDIRM